MILKINGKEENIIGERHILSLLVTRGIRPERVVIEHNHKVVPREDWTEVMLSDGDNVEIISFVGGG